MNGSPGGAVSGIPAPSIRRPRSSMGPNNAPSSATKPDPEMDQAYKDLVMRRRPPSSLGRSASGRENTDPDTPTQNRGGAPVSFLQTPNSGLTTPRTPGLRPRTPSSIVTPSSRPTSRPSLSARSSLAGSTSTPGRRPSVASSTSTPYRRPESRTGMEAKWTPTVGERVRLPSHGYEGTLRYLGPTHIRDGIWAGVELDGGFKGKGRNDGSVDG